MKSIAPSKETETLNSHVNILGIDIGGSSIKYGLVHPGETPLVTHFDQVSLPFSSSPEEYSQALLDVLPDLPPYDCVGAGFPRVVINNMVIEFRYQLDEVWRQVFLSDRLFAPSIPRFAINDADAAGLAEIHRPGAEELRRGVTIVLTLGTGIGSGIFVDGHLHPNTEMGLFQMYGMEAEQYAAPSIKTRENLSLEAWCSRFQEYLELLELYLAPDHLVLGGGISADFEQFRPLLHTRAALRPAFYRNQAGVIGAAQYAALKCASATVDG